MTLSGTVTVWAKPIERGDLRLVAGDVEEALAWFEERTGNEAKLIMLNPKNEHLAQEANDIKVTYSGGILAGEVWLSPEDTFGTDFPRTANTIEWKSECPKSDMRPIIPLGRPPLDLPIEKIFKMHSQGLGVRAIVKRLRDEGIQISRSTIHRAMKKETNRKEWQDAIQE